MILPESGDITPWFALLTSANLFVNAHVNVMRNGVVIADYPIESGKVTLDRTASVRRTCSINVTPVLSGATVDLSWKDLFAAEGNEIRLWYEVTFADGTTDEVNLGTYTIVKSDFQFNGTDLVVKVIGNDRSYLLSESQALSPVTIAQTTIDQAITQFVSSYSFGFPMAYNVVPTTSVLPSTGGIVKPGKTIWSQVQDLAAAAGYEAFFDVQGTLVGQPLPNPSAASKLFDVTTESRSGLVSVTATSTREKVYSIFGVAGSGTVTATSPKTGNIIHKKEVLYASAIDTNPSSPTYAYGSFGEIGKFTRSGIATDQATAQAMADGLLQQQLGKSTELQVEILPFPLLDCWDVVGVSIPSLGVDGTYVVDGWDLTIHYTGTMNLNVRQVF